MLILSRLKINFLITSNSFKFSFAWYWYPFPVWHSYYKNSASVDGVLAPRFAHVSWGSPLGPLWALAEFFRRTFPQNNLQTSPPAPQESYLGFHPQKWTSFLQKTIKIGLFREGGPRNLVFMGILLFWWSTIYSDNIWL